MQKEQFAKSNDPVPFNMTDWVDALSQARKRLASDAGECLRVSAMANALGKINAVVKNDLQRLKQMGVTPAPENAIIAYHAASGKPSAPK